MLYNPNWNTPAPKTKKKLDIWSMESLIAWLETKPADQVYNYGLPNKCLLGQYFTAVGGGGKVYAGVTHVTINKKLFGFIPTPIWSNYTLPAGFNDVAIGRSGFGGGSTRDDWTFGAALERARMYTQGVTP